MNPATLFTGTLTRIDDEGQWTGIYKQARLGSLRIDVNGVEGDQQADRRVHGGPEKAVHHYAAGNYARLCAAFPQAAPQFVAGSLGENISTADPDEHEVYIGDTFAFGSVRLQVSQPRSPCWKIDHRFATPGIARFIAGEGLTGWYYRVLAAGEVESGASLELIERPAGAVSLYQLWRTWNEHRPAHETLLQLADAPALTPAWRNKLKDRHDWLLANAPRPAHD